MFPFKKRKHSITAHQDEEMIDSDSPSSSLDQTSTLLLERHLFNFIRTTKYASSRKVSSSTTNDKNPSKANGGDEVTKHNSNPRSVGNAFESVLSLSLFLDNYSPNSPTDMALTGEKAGDDENEQNNWTLQSSVSFLVSYLEETNSKNEGSNDEDSSLISNEHIASMLLPWSIQTILSSNYKKTVKGQQASETKAISDGSTSDMEKMEFLSWNTCAVSLQTLLLDSPQLMTSNNMDEGDDSNVDNVNCLYEIVQQLRENQQFEFEAKKKKSTISAKNSNKKRKIDQGKTDSDTDANVQRNQHQNLPTSFFSNQGTWNKIVPLAAKVAFNRCHDVQTSTGSPPVPEKEQKDVKNMTSTMAARCYSLIIHSGWYRPSIDQVCGTLLPLLDDLILSSHPLSISTNKSTPSQETDIDLFLEYDQAIMIEMTLHLLTNFIERKNVPGIASAVSNPKKIFSLLSSPKVLPSLARFFQVQIRQQESSTSLQHFKQIEEIVQELVKGILHSGLFHPHHHIDGFRTLNIAVPGLQHKQDDEDANTNSKHGKKKRKKKNGDSAAASNSASHFCYQQNLIQTIESLIKKNGSTMDDIFTMQLLPLMIESFMIQMVAWSEYIKQGSGDIANRNTMKNIMNADAIAKVQFRFFSAIVYPMISRLKSMTSPSNKDDTIDTEESCYGHDSQSYCILLHSIGQCLSLLLKYDAYLPSHVDTEDMHISFLQMVGETVLNAAESTLKSSPTKPTIYDHQEKKHFICLFGDLFQLNHHIFHQKLARVLPIAVHYHSQSTTSKDGKSFLRNNLLCSICTIYQKLRQLPHLMGKILTAAASQNTLDDSSSNNVIFAILGNVEFVHCFMGAIRLSPSEQVHSLWSLLDSYICTHLEGGEREHIATIHFAVDLFVILLKSIAVSKFNAEKIRDQCDETTKSTVSKLIGGSGNDVPKDSSTRSFDLDSQRVMNGLNLCGWIVELHTKCSFWVDEVPTLIQNNDIIDCLEIIPSLLKTTKEVMAEKFDNKYNSKLGALQHLAGHRIQQLHSIIYTKQQLHSTHDENESAKNDNSTVGMVDEIKHLVDFMICAACHRIFEENSTFQVSANVSAGWRIIAKTVATWAPYSSPKHIESFLKWIFFTVAAEIDMSQRDLGVITVNPAENPIPCPVFVEDKAIVLGLLRDTSLFEIKQIHSNFTRVGAACATEIILAALSSEITSQVIDNGFLLPVSDQLWKPLASFDLSNFLAITEKCDKIFDAEKFDTGFFIKRSCFLLDTLNGMACQFYSSQDSRLFFDITLRIHATVSYLLRALDQLSEELVHTLLKIHLICQSSISTILSGLSSTDKLSSFLDPKYINSLILYTFQMSISLIQKDMDWHQEDLDIMKSSGDVACSLLNICSKMHQNKKTYNKEFCAAFDVVIHEGLNNFDKLREITVKANFIRPIILYLIRSAKSQRSNTNAICNDIVDSISQELLEIACDKAGNVKSMEDSSGAALILFISDILRLRRICTGASDTSDDQGKGKVGKNVLSKLGRNIMNLIQHEGVSRKDRKHLESAARYFLCSMSADQSSSGNGFFVDFTEQVQVLIINQHIHDNGQVDPLLQSCYSELLLHEQDENILRLATSLLAGVERSKGAVDIRLISASIYCFGIMMVVFDDEEEQEDEQEKDEGKQSLSTVAHSFLSLSLEVSSPFYTGSSMAYKIWENCIFTAQSCLYSIIGRKDILVLSGSEVATSLASINSIFQHKADISDRIYNISCDIMLAFVKRYPGQLYGCSPTFISALRSLFDCIMKTNTSTNINITNHGLKAFTKLCEALHSHKDILKKHIVTLILDYIDALRLGIDPERKAQLLPAIHMLLDTLSTHETQQMNTMMDSTSKTIYKTVHQNYQKNTYKGQY